MSEVLTVDLFAEDKGHEEFLKPLIHRVAADEKRKVTVKVRSARGGHGVTLRELKLYQRSVLSNVGDLSLPDLLVVARDSNCRSYTETTNEIRNELDAAFANRTILACPDPHVELWYLADLDAFSNVVGVRPSMAAAKCEKGYYKNILASAVIAAGHPPTLGGIEFARELVSAMDLYVAGKTDACLRHFVQDLRNALRQFPEAS